MELYVGVDVSKVSLDLFINGDIIQVNNNLSGYRKIHKKLMTLLKKGFSIKVLCCEASGGYEREFVEFFRKKNNPVHIAHANKVRYFAKSRGYLAKTDGIDARVIAEYAECYKVEDNGFNLTESELALRNLVKRREQLVSDRIRESNRLDKISDKDIIFSINHHVDFLTGQIKEIDAKIKSLSNDLDIKEKFDLITSVPCIGVQTASYIITYLPEIGKSSSKQLSALVGVAPYNNDSGKFRGKRQIYGGRKSLRKMLYMSAVSSIRHYPEMRAMYRKLRDKGKPAKVALIAIVRKLVCVLNSVVSRKTAWQALTWSK